MAKQIKPIFIFSMPRSGSTLLQKMLVSHPKISSHGETWLLLPFVYAIKREGIITEYNECTGQNAISEFISHLPNKEKDYYEELGKFALKLYQKHSNNEMYFIDKTPRYYYIIPEITKMFPNAKFIFLFRNPLDILSSIINTWRKGKFRLASFVDDIWKAPLLLVREYRALKNKCISVNYEALISKPENELEKICSHLNLEFTKEMIDVSSKPKIQGSLGDKNVKNYESISTKSVDRWCDTLNTKYRIKFAKRWLNFIGNKNLKTMGYDKKNLFKQLNLKSTLPGIWDFFNYYFSIIKLKGKLFLKVTRQKKFMAFLKNKGITAK